MVFSSYRGLRSSVDANGSSKSSRHPESSTRKRILSVPQCRQSVGRVVFMNNADTLQQLFLLRNPLAQGYMMMMLSSRVMQIDYLIGIYSALKKKEATVTQVYAGENGDVLS